MHLFSHFRSPWCRKVEWSLAEMGLSHALAVEVIGLNSNDPKIGLENMKKICGTQATVPALVVGDKVLCESSAIVFYLADALSYEGAFFPKGALERATLHQWDRICDLKLGAEILSPWLRNTLFLGEGQFPDANVFKKASENFAKLEARLLDTLEKSAFLAGSDFTYADVGMSHLLVQLARVDGPQLTSATVQRWFQSCVNREAYENLAARSS
jgi:glutathione S-transferase